MMKTRTSAIAGLVSAASPYLAGFDTDEVMSRRAAESYYAQGYRFCLRYLSLGGDAPRDLSRDEVAAILEAMLALMPVQHVDRSGWAPTAALGQSHGVAAARSAARAGFPGGVCVWMDLEGVASSTRSADVTAYCQSWCSEVAAAGYVPGLYVGASCGLSESELSSLPFRHYWRSASDVPEPSRGYQLSQGRTAGVLDPDVSSNDAGGGQALWLATSTPVYPTLKASTAGARPSEAVKGLQRALNAARAAAPIQVDGLFGAATTAALRRFQAGAGLSANGVADAPTWSALVAAAASPPMAPSAAMLPYAPVLPMTSQVHQVFDKCLGLIPVDSEEDLAAQLAMVLGAPADHDVGTIVPGALATIADVLAALAARARPESKLQVRLCALQGFYRAQADSPSATLPRVAVVSAAISQVGVVDARTRDPLHPALRFGAASLLEYFRTAFGGDTGFDPSVVLQLDERPLPQWCGIFALWASKAAGQWAGDWQAGRGIASVPGFVQVAPSDAQPGDVGVIPQKDHMFVIASVSGRGSLATVTSVDGNSGATGVIQMATRQLGALCGVYRAAGLDVPKPAVPAQLAGVGRVSR